MRSPVYWASDAIRACLRGLVPSRRALRVFSYFSCISLVGLAFEARTLHAAAREDAFTLGHELLGLSDLTAGAETVSLNGARFHHAMNSSSAPLHAVLDRIEQHCREQPGSAARVLDQLAVHDPKRFQRHAPPGAMRSAVFREESGPRGMIVCFVGGPDPASVADWLAALRRFSQSRDLSSFGRLRYSFAESAEHGATRVVTLWADDGLDLSALFPKTGDARGSDSPSIPRPPGARRTLTASAGGMPFSVHGYESQQSLADIQRFYDTWMRQHGYQNAHISEPDVSSYLHASGNQVFISLLQSDQRALVTVTESGQVDTSAELEMEGAP